ncbi:MAG: hypothetical protein LBG26_03030 [Treponema sp.]|jgi:hypothetical protein|nr:hypothetical protein [Treponema sp.]
MAGILDEVMDGITAKEKLTPPPATAPAAPPQASPPPAPPAAQTTPPASGEKGMHVYSDDFKKKYGERKKPA